MCKQLILEGAKRWLYWIADASGDFRAKDYYERLDTKKGARFDTLFNRMAREGIHNKQHFRRVSEHISYFKVGQHRITCFYDDQDLVLVSGFDKKVRKDKRYRREISTTERLRTEYLETKERHDQ